ncbi:hypothetical protein, partial [Streptomyces sp. ISL-100]|uniref:hypothetical protein n=1 Tax=Streptomyces sp. ISL-100 TaxID=2819173 RepID=UPI001BEBCB31
ENDQSWDLFAVMTTDVQKASLTLESLLSQYIGVPPAQQTRTVLEYLRAAKRRAAAFRAATPETPLIFTVLEEDIEHAIDDLETVERQLLDTPPSPSPPVIVPVPAPAPAGSPSG